MKQIQTILCETRGFWISAVSLLALYGIAELFAMRQYVTMLSGTSVGGNWPLSVVLGLVYIGLYLAAVIVTPILTLASVIYGIFVWRFPPPRPDRLDSNSQPE